jgi:hypothetical protein
MALLFGGAVSISEASLLRVDREVEALNFSALQNASGNNEGFVCDGDKLGSDFNHLGEVDGSHSLSAAILSTAAIAFTNPKMICYAYRSPRSEGAPWPLLKVPRSL